jgi:hypothetical protein
MKFPFLFFITAGIVACVSVQACTFDGRDYVDKRLISCSNIADSIIDLSSRGIVHLNADAFDFNINLINL